MKRKRVWSIFRVAFLALSFLLLTGCSYTGDVANHPVPELGQIEHVFGGPFLITTKGNVIIEKSQLIHSNENNNEASRTAPSRLVQIDKLVSVIKIIRGKHQIFALKENGDVWFWGEPIKYIERGGLFHIEPQVKSATKFPYATQVVDIWASGDGFIFKKKDGSVWGWNAEDCHTPTQSEMDEVFVGTEEEMEKIRLKAHLAVHSYSWLENAKEVGSCMAELKNDGTVWETKGESNTMVSGLKDIVAIQEGYFFQYALDKYGNVWTWGAVKSNVFKGNGTEFVPVGSNLGEIVALEHPVLLLDHVKQISGAFGLQEDGSVWYLDKQTKLASLQGIKEIGGDLNEVVALTSDGKVFAGDQDGNTREIVP
jgi:alpha-tubulin suppressor-like RCC1 family protein